MEAIKEKDKELPEKLKSPGVNGASAVAGKLFQNHNNNLNVESSDKE